MSKILNQHELLKTVGASDVLDYMWSHSVGGMAFVDPKGAFLCVNPTLCSWLGYAPNELENMTIMDVTEPGDTKADMAAMDDVLRGIRNSYTMTKRYKPKSGQPFDAKLTVHGWKGDDGKIVLFFFSQVEKLDLVEYRPVDELRVVYNFFVNNKKITLIAFIATALAGDSAIKWLFSVIDIIRGTF